MRAKIINFVEGYKYLHFINYCLSHGKYRLLEDTLGPEAAIMLQKVPNYIKYQLQDYDLYSYIEEVIETGKPMLAKPHDIDLESYVKGIYERNTLLWSGEDKEEILGFAKGKLILDFGCGSGFYAEIFNAMGAATYLYDRAEIAKVMKTFKPNLVVNTDLTNIDKFEIVWLSEVLHGKNEKERRRLLNSLVTSMNKGQCIAINELKPDTPLSQMFHWQMKIHCEGEMLDPGTIIEEAIESGLTMIDYASSTYHEILIFEKEKA